MNDGHEMLNRLVWREAREWRLALWLGLILPVFAVGLEFLLQWMEGFGALSFAVREFRREIWMPDLPNFIAFLIVAVVLAWGLGKGAGYSMYQEGDLARERLPVDPQQSWYVKSLVNGLVGALLASWVVVSLWIVVGGNNLPTVVGLCLIGFFAVFQLSYLFSVLHVACSAGMIVVGFALVALIGEFEVEIANDFVFLTAVAVGSMAGSWFAACFKRGRLIDPVLRGAVALIPLMCICLVICLSPRPSSEWESDLPRMSYYSARNGNLYAHLSGATPEGLKRPRTPQEFPYPTVQVRDLVSRKRWVWRLRTDIGAVAMLGIHDAHKVYVLFQQTDGSPIQIACLDVPNRKQATLAEIPPGGPLGSRDDRGLFADLLLGGWMFMFQDSTGSVSPDGSRALVWRPSRAGAGSDLWLCDLQSGRSRMVKCNFRGVPDDAEWLLGKALVGGKGDAVSVDLTTGHAEAVQMPVPPEMQNDRSPIRADISPFSQ